jgi:divalent metal cation (Fe/Co/Zn/Cd) transporter
VTAASRTAVIRLDALSSARALAGLLVTAFICHVGFQVTADVVRRMADGVDSAVIKTAEAAVGIRLDEHSGSYLSAKSTEPVLEHLRLPGHCL